MNIEKSQHTLMSLSGVRNTDQRISTNSNDAPKIPKLQITKGFALWRLYAHKLLRRHGVLYVLTNEEPDRAVSTSEAQQKWEEDDRKARPHIVLNLDEEPATLLTTLFISNATT